MRRPVGVKWVLLFLVGQGFSRAELATVAILPSPVVNEHGLAASWAFSFQPVLPPVRRPLLISKDAVGPGVRRSHRNSALGSCFSFLRMVWFYAAAGIVLCWLLCSGSYASPLTHK
jgi:hypothetical protein